MRTHATLVVGGTSNTVILLRVTDGNALVCAAPTIAVGSAVSLKFVDPERGELVATGKVARRVGKDALVVALDADDVREESDPQPTPASAVRPTRRMIPPVLTSLRAVCKESDGEEPILSGQLNHIGIAALLGWLEYTERSGRLELIRHDANFTIVLAHGSVVDIRSSSSAGSVHDLLYGALGWKSGAYALWPMTGPARKRGISITRLLIGAREAELREAPPR